jgi:hypothetical protein
VWFRELPQPILNSIPNAELHKCEEISDSLKLYETLPEPQKTLMKWIVDLLADTAARESSNKMGARNLGTNIYKCVVYIV